MVKGEYDVVVIGAGPVGAAAALELRAAGFDLLLLESRPPQTRTGDLRPLALSYGSRLILERLGLWQALSPATAIESIHVSHEGRFGRTLLTARESGLTALGYVVDYRGLVAVLERAVADSHVPVLYAAHVSSIAHDKRSARIEFQTAEGGGECLASIVIVADGNSAVVDGEAQLVDYGHTAVTARLEIDRAHANRAYERFTTEGPLALLPFDGGYAVVWSTSPMHAQELCDASPASFLQELQARFGERAGRFKSVAARAAQALSLRYARRTTVGRAVLIGNAAQALHPVAGQGFNLGLRDAWELASEMREHGARGERLLEAYRSRRRIDRIGGTLFTHSLVNIFSNDFTPLAVARGAGLALLDCIPSAKDFVVRRMVFGSRG